MRLSEFPAAALAFAALDVSSCFLWPLRSGQSLLGIELADPFNTE
jgi:hypothetical protein